MTGGDADLKRRVEELEKYREADRRWKERVDRWKERVDALINKGKGFWFAAIMIGSLIAAALAAGWELLKHGRGVTGG